MADSDSTLRLLASTHEKFVKGWDDQVTDDNVLLNKLKSKGKMLFNKSGTQIERQLRGAESGTIKGWKGYDEIDFVAENLTTPGVWVWRGLKGDYLIPVWDLLQNKGEEKIFDLQRDNLEMVLEDFMTALNTNLYTATDGKTVDGLASYNTNTGSYASVSQTANAWWQAFRVNGDSGANTSFASGDDWKEQLGKCITGATRGGKRTSPEIGITDDATWNLMHLKLTALERYVDSDVANAGFRNFMFQGVPLVNDKNSPSGIINLLNFNFIEMWHTTERMFRTDVEKKNSPIAFFAVIYAMHNLTLNSLRHQGIVYNTD